MNMSKQLSGSNKRRQRHQTLLNIGSVLLVIGVLLYGVPAIGYQAGWIISLGGLVAALGCILSASDNKDLPTRYKRLERMLLLAMLIYLIAGGFMIQRSTSWLMIFIVATLFYLYSIFAIDRIDKKERKEHAGQ